VVTAADAERRRVERDLHDGAQQRLLTLGLALQLLGDEQGNAELVRDAQAELQAALRELRELARGIHPAILSDRGLAAAVASLADRAPIPVVTRVTPERWPDAVESTAYFVVCEALANVTKHAGARHARVSITHADDRLVVEVSDDGRGGADAAGSGLRGLADRVGALDGTFTVAPAGAAGTAIRAEIPCGSPSPTIPR
jgi:signal transduction histidine kinase